VNPETLRRLDRVIWAKVAIVALVVLASPLMTDFRIVLETFTAPAVACTVLFALGCFYSSWRSDIRLASGLLCTAQLIAFAAVAAPLSYIAASASGPLWDQRFDVIDRALGFDWKALLSWMNASPTTYALLHPVYLSLSLQMTSAVLVLAFSGRLLALRLYTLAFLITVLVSIGISAAVPAAGAWPHYGLAPSDSQIMPAVSTSWPVFYGLREGTFRSLVAVGAEGIITFPSVHAALAAIITVALWPVAIVRWLFLFLNMAMLAATPIDGSHYLVDVLAGLAIAALSLLLAQAVAGRIASPAARGPQITQAAMRSHGSLVTPSRTPR
jgi:membrane-associated phospholipid phosphatase